MSDGTRTVGRTPFVSDPDFKLYVGEARDVLADLDESLVNCVVTSPPYYLLRDYDVDGQIGMENTMTEYIAALVDVFRSVRRVLREDGVMWVNIADTHCAPGRGNRHAHTSKLSTPARQELVSPVVNKVGRHPGVKRKDLFGVPFELALALRDDGWWLRQTVIWDKAQVVPERVRDRPTTSHEFVFLFAKSARYYFDADAIAEPATWDRWGAQTAKKDIVGRASLAKREVTEELSARATRNCRSVWRMNSAQFPEAHYAVMPDELAERCILAGCPPDGLVLDPFAGAGTTAAAARRLGRQSIAIELSEASAIIAARRLGQQSLLAEAVA